MVGPGQPGKLPPTTGRAGQRLHLVDVQNESRKTKGTKRNRKPSLAFSPVSCQHQEDLPERAGGPNEKAMETKRSYSQYK